MIGRMKFPNFRLHLFTFSFTISVRKVSPETLANLKAPRRANISSWHVYGMSREASHLAFLTWAWPGFRYGLADYQWVSVIIRAALLNIKWPLANKTQHLARVWGCLDS